MMMIYCVKFVSVLCSYCAVNEFCPSEDLLTFVFRLPVCAKVSANGLVFVALMMAVPFEHIMGMMMMRAFDELE